MNLLVSSSALPSPGSSSASADRWPALTDGIGNFENHLSDEESPNDGASAAGGATAATATSSVNHQRRFYENAGSGSEGVVTTTNATLNAEMLAESNIPSSSLHRPTVPPHIGSQSSEADTIADCAKSSESLSGQPSTDGTLKLKQICYTNNSSLNTNSAIIETVHLPASNRCCSDVLPDEAIPRIYEFLEGSGGQLTVYGLLAITETLRERELAVLFRNNHFSVIFRNDNQLYSLVTDQGFLKTPSVVWELLDSVDGNTEYLTETFQHYSSSAPLTTPAATSSSTVSDHKRNSIEELINNSAFKPIREFHPSNTSPLAAAAPRGAVARSGASTARSHSNLAATRVPLTPPGKSPGKKPLSLFRRHRENNHSCSTEDVSVIAAAAASGNRIQSKRRSHQCHHQ
eukprot:Filipodium_phascolosomae@DN1524_c0_g1_i1.p1